MSDEVFDDPTIVDPDEEQQARYNWDEEFQRHVICLLLCDRQFLLQGMDLIKPSYFTNKVHQKACGITFRFFKKYNNLPRKTFLIQEIKGDLKDDKALVAYLAELNLLFDYFEPGLDSMDYLLDKITYFAKIQAVRKAFNVSLKEISNDPESEETWGKVYDNLRQAMLVERNFDIGLDYFVTARDRYEKMDDGDAGDRFITGFPSVDTELMHGGYTQGELLSIVGDSGVGKSRCLTNMIAINVMRGYKGLYISLEMGECEVADRLDAMITGAPIQSLRDHKDTILEVLEGKRPIPGRLDKDHQPMYFDPESSKGSILIKQFPSGQASIGTIQAYISQIKFHGYEPDFVVLDYLGLLKPTPGEKKYDWMEQAVTDFRGLGGVENFFAVIAQQPNRGAKELQKVDGHIGQGELADSFGSMRAAEGLISLNQNDVEAGLNVGRGWVEKQRNGKKRYKFWLQFNPENLTIKEISQSTYMELKNKNQSEIVEEVDVDLIKNSSEQENERRDAKVHTFVPSAERENGENSEDC